MSNKNKYLDYYSGAIYPVPKVKVSGKYRVRMKKRGIDTAPFLERLKGAAKKTKYGEQGFYAELSRITGSASQNIRKYFTDRTVPSEKAIERIAQRLNTTPEELVKGCEPYTEEFEQDIWMFKDEGHTWSTNEIIEVEELIEEDIQYWLMEG